MFEMKSAGLAGQRRLALLLLGALIALLAALAPAAASRNLPARAQPLLLELARRQPQQRVGIIVQKLALDGSVERLVAALGGQVTMDLRLIHGFAAELPAGQVPALARAAGVRWVSYDAPVVETGKSGGDGGSTESSCAECVDTSALKQAHIRTIRADKVWNVAPYLQGQGLGVAIVDSGITGHPDLDTNKNTRVITAVKFNSNSNNASDWYGHGTHVAGIAGGNGSNSSGGYMGVAPKVNLINVKVSDDQGAATARDVVNGLQWIYENKSTYNIRVVNLSLNSSVPESYHTSPLDAAVEVLWFNGIVVVVSAGNNGGDLDQGILYPPANDPFVITVGATDDRGTVDLGDDTLATFSSYGTTDAGYAKPELAAPGRNIISTMASGSAVLPSSYPANVVSAKNRYFRMSGTSMAAPMVAGAAALLLQDEPGLNPDQVKYPLMATAQPFNHPGAGAGVLDVYAAVNGTTTETANTGRAPSALLCSGSCSSDWDSTSWNSVSWGSVSWGSVSWGSVSWGSVSWGSTHWGD